MSQVKFYKYLVGCLLLLNVAVLSFFLWSNAGNQPPERPGPRPVNSQEEMIRALQLDDDQATTFRLLADDHRRKTRTINEKQQRLLLPYFESLVHPAEGIDEDSALSEYQRLEREKIEITHQHFREIRSLLNEDQAPLFEQLMGDVVDRMLLGRRKGPRPRQGRR